MDADQLPLEGQDRAGVVALGERLPVNAGPVMMPLDRVQRDEALERVLESLPAGAYTCNAAGLITFYNARAVEIWGRAPRLLHPEERYCGSHHIYLPDRRPLAHEQCFMALALREGRSFSGVEVSIERPGGERRTVLAHVHPLRDASGALIGAANVLVDITDRRRMEEELRASQERLRIAIESAGMSAWTAHLERDEIKSIACSDHWVRNVATAPKGLRQLLAELHPEDQAHILEVLRQALDTGQPYVVESREQLADGNLRWSVTRGRALANSVTGQQEVFGVTLDITEQKRAQQALLASEQRHRQLVEHLGDGVWAADRNALTTFVNPRVTELLGYRAEEMLGRPIVDFMSPEFARQITERQQRRQRGVTDRGEFEFVKRDGCRLLAAVTAYPLTDEDGRFAGSVAVISDVTARKRAEQELRDSEARLHSVWQNSVDGMRLTDADGRIVDANAAYCRLVGLSRETLAGQLFTMVYEGPQAAQDALDRYCQRFQARTVRPREARTARFRRGHTAILEISSSFVEVAGRPPLLLSIFRDVTERKRAEELLHHSQKMDAIGKLAGGVAHDFNNLLLVILGYADVLLTTTAETDPRRESLVAITAAAERAASLTRQLLAFSRRTMLEPKVLDLNAIVQETERLLDRLIGEDIRLCSVLESDLSRVKADPGQLSQILLNLAVNARDAMPKGGQLTIETKNVELDEAAVRENPDVGPGKFVLLAITDSGVGMPAEVQRHVFEPFFTTKEVGSGTGLGLAVVHGIVKQSGGHIDFSSRVGAGTTFRIYFPAVDAGDQVGARRAAPAERRGLETVLLVEDEEGVRALAQEVLKSNGYHVLEASHGLEALRVAECHRGPLHLLLTDVVMPKMDGRDLAEVLRRRYPELLVMYMSGYTDDEVLRRGLSSASFAFLQKPYTPAALAEKVRQVLDRV